MRPVPGFQSPDHRACTEARRSDHRITRFFSSFHLLRKRLHELLHFRLDDELAVRLPWIVSVILLMVVFGDEKLGCWLYRCDYRIRPRASSIQFGNRRFCFLALLIRNVKNHGTVLGTGIVSLPVQRGGIVDGEENIEQITITKLGWVKGH